MEGETVYTWDESQKTVAVDEPSSTVNASIMLMRNRETYEKFEDVIYKVGPNIDYKNGFVIGGHTNKRSYELNDDLPKSLETPLQKLSRLQKETVDMVTFLQTLPQNKESDELNGETPAAVLAEMEQVRDALDALMLSPEIQSVDTNSVSPLTGKVSSNVIAKASTIIGGSSSQAHPSLVSRIPESAPSKMDSSRVLTLENRLACLESILGASPSQILPFSNVSNGLEEVALRLAAIDPQRLEAISKKTRGLLGELDDLSESMGRVVGHAGHGVHFDGEDNSSSDMAKGVQALALDLAHVGKVDALYDIVYQWRAAGPALPILASRLESLKAVHQNSASIAARLQTVEAQQKNIALVMENAFDSLEETKVSIKASLESMARSVEVLERRFEALGK